MNILVKNMNLVEMIYSKLVCNLESVKSKRARIIEIQEADASHLRKFLEQIF